MFVLSCDVCPLNYILDRGCYDSECEKMREFVNTLLYEKENETESHKDCLNCKHSAFSDMYLECSQCHSNINENVKDCGFWEAK